MVVDLNAPLDNNIRQVDHRTIESIVYKNVKYSIGKKDQDVCELPVKPLKDRKANWDGNKLVVGDWFSYVSYYQVKKLGSGDQIYVCTNQD